MKTILIYNLIGIALAAAVIIPLAAAEGDNYTTQTQRIYKAACKNGSHLRALLVNGISINAIDKQGNTALMLAAAANQIQVVALLVNNGANVNMQNQAGDTALMLAAANGAAEIVCLLLDANASPNIKNRKGETAIQIAHNAGYEDIAGIIGRAGGQ